MKVIKLVLIRHGESLWNQENRFTGWVDVDLSDTGYIEAQNAGKLLKSNGFVFDFGYTSVLTRAIRTLWIILDQLNQIWLPIEKSWKLNERHYGFLQGLNKDKVAKKYGRTILQQWRRSFNVIPSKIDRSSQFIGIDDVRYKKINYNDLPNGESLKLTYDRVIPYWNNYIVPKIKNRDVIIVVAHGNSIRSIVKFLNNLNESEIFKVEIPTGSPLIYEFDKDVNPIRNYYLI